MRKTILTFAMLVVLVSATFVKADVMDLREPSFPGAGAGEGDLVTVSAPGTVDMLGKAFIGGLLTMSFYR